MKSKLLPVTGLALLVSFPAFAADVNVSGKWLIDSSVGGKTPIKVHCALEQKGNELGGTCTPEMANAEPAKLTGKLENGKANWGYGVVFQNKPGRVEFRADSVANDKISGILSLSGTEAPFTAKRE